MSDWFDRAFGSWYLRLYPHRDASEAERAVSMLLPRLSDGGCLLDVGCGSGRHAAALRQHGVDVFGIDRSPQLLAEARTRIELQGRLVRGDMRALPFGPGHFSAILSMFTSFGYFGPRQAHVDLLGEFHRVCSPGGTLVLDYLNVLQTRDTLVPESSRRVGDYLIREERRLHRGDAGEQAIKDVTITDATGKVLEAYQERVSLYERPELLEMLTSSGWRADELLGEYDGSPWSPRSSRTIVIARAEGSR